jgi:hypothetical protein
MHDRNEFSTGFIDLSFSVWYCHETTEKQNVSLIAALNNLTISEES